MNSKISFSKTGSFRLLVFDFGFQYNIVDQLTKNFEVTVFTTKDNPNYTNSSNPIKKYNVIQADVSYKKIEELGNLSGQD